MIIHQKRKWLSNEGMLPKRYGDIATGAYSILIFFLVLFSFSYQLLLFLRCDILFNKVFYSVKEKKTYFVTNLRIYTLIIHSIDQHTVVNHIAQHRRTQRIYLRTVPALISSGQYILITERFVNIPNIGIVPNIEVVTITDHGFA